MAGPAARRAGRRDRRPGDAVSRYVGSDPNRVAGLRRRVIAAIEHLAALASDDPAAASAVAAARAIGHELATEWLPTLGRLADDTSMTGWRSIDPHPSAHHVSASIAAASSFDGYRHRSATAPTSPIDDALASCADLLDGRGDPAD